MAAKIAVIPLDIEHVIAEQANTIMSKLHSVCNHDIAYSVHSLPMGVTHIRIEFQSNTDAATAVLCGIINQDQYIV